MSHLAEPLDSLRATAVQRDLTRQAPIREVRNLVAAGLGAAQIPTEFGGSGLDVPALLQVLVEVASADPNVTQLMRGHFAFVEDLLHAEQQRRERWFPLLVSGALVGNAMAERASATEEAMTKIDSAEGPLTVTGEKVYTTGSALADWIDVSARCPNGRDYFVTVDVRAEGVKVIDDWDGFGQRTTATGTVLLKDVLVDTADLVPADSRFAYQGAFYQAILLATQAGILVNVADDLTREIQNRDRTYSHGNGASIRADPQVLQIVGELHSAAVAARALVERAGDFLQNARESAADEHANLRAEIEVASAQVALQGLLFQATSLFLNPLGASALATSKGLDRHWRNARAVASHNPIFYRARGIGDYFVNGTSPVTGWGLIRTAAK